MSQGAIFKLVLRDERFDKFFTASDYLRQRLDAARAKRKAAGEENVQPTFVDIERSHILYIRAAYRPYVSVASEYVRVKASGDGTASIGPAGGTLQFTFPIYGHFTSDMAVHLRFKAIGSAAAAEPTAAAPYLRYCALPGLRVFRKVELRSDQILVDEYGPDDAVAYSKFFVRADHRAGWDRCHGQQEAREAIYLANGFTGSMMYRDGPQTPKLYQESFDIIVPLQFWLGRDASHALLNDLIPNSQRTVTCELAPLKDIVQALVPGASNPGPPPAGGAVAPAGLVPADLPFSKLGIEADLYVNGLYVNPEIHDVFASRVGFSLIRVHRRQVNQLQSESDAFLLDQLKFPAEYLMVGIRSRRLADDFDRWWLMGSPRQRADANKLLVPAMVWNSTIGSGICQLVCREAVEVTTLESSVDTIGVTAHGIEIFPQLPSLFYNAYMPVRYAENTMVVSPIDTSAFLVNFCLYPGKFNPSGYYNLSAGREMYINYSLKPAASDIVAGDSEMVISLSALNFLIRKGDKLSLRYSL
jgi:hypothetical protein